MHIAIVGAGIVGVTTAYELAADGHAVTLLERHASVASETSYANAGVLAPGYVTPWAAPGVPLRTLLALGSRHRAVRFAAGWPRALPWLARFLAACRADAYARHRSALHALAQYSIERLAALEDEHRLQYEQEQGYLVLLRSPRELARNRAGLDVLERLSVRHAVVDANRCREIEPGLCEQTPLHAGIHLSQDRVGNCRLFAQHLKSLAIQKGARFLHGHTVRSIRPGRPVRLAIEGPQGAEELRCDAVVVCAGVDSTRLLTPLGLRLPLLPVWGYSLSAPLRSLASDSAVIGPRAGLMDERYKVALTRLGSRVRVAGSAEIGGGERLRQAPVATLHRVLADWFPGQADLSNAQVWKGARPMLAEGPPLIGPSRHEGVWLNLGHGSSGWALACGSARGVADLLAGRSPALEFSPYSPARLG